jgi:Skp family chaperone for outer membrane proteins
MNQLSKIAFVLCSAVLTLPSRAQAPATKPATQSIVTVSFNDVVLHSAEAQKALSLLQAQVAPRQAQIQALNDEVEALRKKLENANEKASDAERAISAEALDRKEKQLQRQADDFRTDSQAESQQVFQRVAQKVFAFLQTYAQQHGYSAVIERGTDASPVVWYVTNNMDITDQLIKAYDTQSGAVTPQTPTRPSDPGPTKAPESLPESPSPRP